MSDAFRRTRRLLVDPHQFALSAMRLPFEVAPGLSMGVLVRSKAKAGPFLPLFGFGLGRQVTVQDAAIPLPLPEYWHECARLGR
jgi:hypothetical protein